MCEMGPDNRQRKFFCLNPFVQVFYSNEGLACVMMQEKYGLNPFVQVFRLYEFRQKLEVAGFQPPLIPLFRSFILINRPGFEVVSAKKRLNPFVQVFYSNEAIKMAYYDNRIKES